MAGELSAGAAPSDAAPPKGRSRPRAQPAVYWLDRSFAWWSFLPAVLLMGMLTLYPIVNLAWMSVSTIEFGQGRDIWTFTPARNVDLLISDRVLRDAFLNTLIFVIVSVAAEMILGLGLALLVGRLTRGKGLIRTVMILPILVPPVAIGSMWKLMYNYDFGVFNQLAMAVGIEPINWLGSTSLALLSVIIVDIWHWTPFVFLILFAAVAGLPVDVLEAARVDGATGWKELRHIVLPLLRPALAVALTFRSILAFKAFDEVYLLTSGGPGTSTELIGLHLYKVFFEQNQLGYGAMLSLAVIGAIAGFLLVSRQALTRGTSA
jgi:multiple sugar transport system permease protein